MESHEKPTSVSSHSQDEAINPAKSFEGQTIWDAWRIGVVGFGLASLAVFGSWAFLGKWFYGTLGELGAYIAWLVLYLGIGCESMQGLINCERRRIRFFKVFSSSFAAYAILWIVVWMVWKNSFGEWLAAGLGSLGMALVLCLSFQNFKEWHRLWVVLAISNMTGYFIGSWLHARMEMPWGAVAWGIAYGFFFGGGIGPAFWIVQRGVKN